MSPPAIEGEIIVERGVLVGGLMVFGSFLLAALLNRSAMEEVPAPPPVAPVTVGAPLDAAAAEATLAPISSACAATKAQVDSEAPLPQAEQAAPDCGDQAD